MTPIVSIQKELTKEDNSFYIFNYVLININVSNYQMTLREQRLRSEPRQKVLSNQDYIDVLQV
ncbi:hypothetical protein PMSM_01675 [Paenibacillus macquariensis subsp. macquariensis]|nr:hypothetical protein PMSM_01675 [Paenibacillus macquariensis subsp. macquariensis]